MKRIKIAFIHNNKKRGTGADFINHLIATTLREKDIEVNSFYPRFLFTDTPINFKGINNILFFYSLLERRKEILNHDIIHGTTYRPLAFLHFSKPVISHFGSTTAGFLRAVPKTQLLEKECSEIFLRLKQSGVISELNLKTCRPLNDIVAIERYTAAHSNCVIATSHIVKHDLEASGITPEKIEVIHNAIEDYWFDTFDINLSAKPALVFVGRIGEDIFTLKLKGVGRLIWLFEQFPEIDKCSIVMSKNNKLVQWMSDNISNHCTVANAIKNDIPPLLKKYAGSIFLLTSRYEGFSLSLVEAMSQCLVPISFAVGIAPEIIRNGENGFLVSTIEEAREKIDLLLTNTSLRHCMALAAKETAKQFFSEIMINKIIALYKKILGY